MITNWLKLIAQNVSYEQWNYLSKLTKESISLLKNKLIHTVLFNFKLLFWYNFSNKLRLSLSNNVPSLVELITWCLPTSQIFVYVVTPMKERTGSRHKGWVGHNEWHPFSCANSARPTMQGIVTLHLFFIHLECLPLAFSI